MAVTDIYPYASGDLLNERNTYFYSAFRGEPFLVAWSAQRDAIFNKSSESVPGRLEKVTPADKIIAEIQSMLSAGSAPAERAVALLKLDRLVQRFEVSKRIYDAYSSNWKAVDPTAFQTLPSYARFAETLIIAYECTGALTYLNALLKSVDTLTSLRDRLSPGVLGRLTGILAAEKSFIAALRAGTALHERDSSWKPAHAITTGHGGQSAPTKLSGVAMIACASARSQAYLQALVERGMMPEQVIFLGPDTQTADAAVSGSETWSGLSLPRLGESVTETCHKAGIPISFTSERDVNSDAAADLVRASGAKFVIYSGIGGQIVSERILGIGPRLLHMHSGWLPGYRGSTTLYYALLNGAGPGVTAIFLDPGIDTGPILARRHYPVPPHWIDVDLVYDSAIRADLLCQVMAGYRDTGRVDETVGQLSDEGRTYYVIHPVLKHIALLSLGKECND